MEEERKEEDDRGVGETFLSGIKVRDSVTQ